MEPRQPSQSPEDDSVLEQLNIHEVEDVDDFNNGIAADTGSADERALEDIDAADEANSRVAETKISQLQGYISGQFENSENCTRMPVRSHDRTTNSFSFGISNRLKRV